MICIIPGYKLIDSSDRLLHLSATHLTRTTSMAPKERNNDHNDSEDTKKNAEDTFNEGTDFLSFSFNRNNRQIDKHVPSRKI